MPSTLAQPLRRIGASFALSAMSALSALCVLSGHASAQTTTSPDSRITQVKVYPGSATVERVARVRAGSRTLVFACLPATLDVQSLQVTADASVRIGETTMQTDDRAQSTRCAGNALDARIRELEDAKGALQSESDAEALVTGYLRGLSGGADDAAKRAAVDAKTVATMADALRRTGQSALEKQRQIARRQADIDRQLQPLLAERARLQGSDGGRVVNVAVTLAANADAEVRLSYQIAGPGWTPTYRALLDTASGKLRIERQALVAQATGEDWRGVRLVLSTGQPRRETAGRLPYPWRIGVMPPPQVASPAPAMAYAPAAVAARMDVLQKPGTPPPPLFDASVFNNSFATEFVLPQTIDVASTGQRVSLMLGQHEDTAKLAARTSPRIDPSAFLVAEIAPPSGVWPNGPMQLYRDGAFVGTGAWSIGTDPRVTLSFGRDELVMVRAEPERDNQGSGGFVGNRSERKVQRAYTVENRHRTPITVQVLEAAPVSVDEQVRVTTQFDPQPTDPTFNKQPGLTLWSFDLAAGKTARVSADYTISHPKDVRLQER